MPITKAPTEITPALLEVVVMPNGEVICMGKSLGWAGPSRTQSLGPYLTPREDPAPPATVYVLMAESNGESAEGPSGWTEGVYATLEAAQQRMENLKARDRAEGKTIYGDEEITAPGDIDPDDWDKDYAIEVHEVLTVAAPAKVGEL